MLKATTKINKWTWKMKPKIQIFSQNYHKNILNFPTFHFLLFKKKYIIKKLIDCWFEIRITNANFVGTLEDWIIPFNIQFATDDLW